MRRPVLALVLVGLCTLTATSSGSRGASWPPQVTPLTSPAGVESGQPQMSASADGTILSWIERAGPKAILKFARRTASGWSEARTVASGDDWFVNWADVPSVVALDLPRRSSEAATGDNSLTAHWLQKSGPGTYAYDVKLSFSHDDGKTWSAPITPYADRTKTEHGFASLFPMPGAGLGLVWLDGRAMSGQHGGEGDMSVRFGAFTRDGRQTAETALDLRACECCPTTAAVTPDGVIVAYRDRSADEIRDIYVTRLTNGKWTPPAAVHHDGWQVPACPVNGPALSARGGNVAIAWFTMKGQQGHAYVAFSSDAGRTFAAPVQIDDTMSAGRVDVEVLADGAAIATWIETVSEGAEFRARRIEPSGTRSAALTVARITASRSSGYPRLALNGNELLFAWTDRDGSSLRVRTAAASLSR